MRIGGIDFPQEIIDAAQDGKLVVFAGAGVSIGPPAKLPSFAGLVEKIADGRLERAEQETEDIVFLGRLIDQGLDVHKKASEILSKPGSAPTDLHRNLLRLFPEPGKLRLVTTNFDRHFETAAEEVWGSEGTLEIYESPALPVGSDFTGLVYLHGRLGKNPQRVVLTDQDFGRAYLTEGWARRFTVALFSTFPVLFVGYSHGETILRYLARGLWKGLGPKRYALTERDSKVPWRSLGIRAVEFEQEEKDDYSELYAGVHGLADLLRKGALDHERRIRSLVEGAPEGVIGEEDYLRYCLSKPELAQYFVRFAQWPSWLEWADRNGLLASVFHGANGGAQETGRTSLAGWFAQFCLSDHDTVALRIAIRSEGAWSPELWNAIVYRIIQCFRENNSIEPAERTKRAFRWWLLLKERLGPGKSLRLLGKWFEVCDPASDKELMLELLSTLTRPLVRLDSPPELDASALGSCGFEELPVLTHPQILAEQHAADSWNDPTYLRWRKKILSNIGQYVRPLELLVANHLERLHGQYIMVDDDAENSDELSLSRPAIEDDEQNSRFGNKPAHLLVDLGRDVLDWYLENAEEEATRLTETWMQLSAPLLRRLALYGFNRTKRLSPDEKISRVLSEGWLKKRELRPETFRILYDCYPGAEGPTRQQLISFDFTRWIGSWEQHDRLRQEDAPGAEHSARKHYGFLLWLSESDSACKLCQKALMQVTQRYPDFEPDGHRLDLIRSVVDLNSAGVSISEKEVAAMSPDVYLQELRALQSDKTWSGQTRFQDFIRQTSVVVKEDFSWGLALAQELRARKDAESAAWAAILEGWKSALLDENNWLMMLDLLEGAPSLLKRHGGNIASVLEYRLSCWGQRKVSLLMVERGVRLAGAIVRKVPSLTGSMADTKRLSLALKDAVGAVAMFLVRATSLWLSLQEDRSEPMPDFIRRPIEELVIPREATPSPLARAIFASHLHFYWSIDSDWARLHLLRFFDWEADPVAARQVWNRFLSWGRHSDILVPDLLPYLLSTFDHLDELEKLSKVRLVSLLSDMLVFSPTRPEIWLDNFLASSSAKGRHHLACDVGSRLKELKPNQVEATWGTRLKPLIRRRLEGLPQLDHLEWAAIVDWAPHLLPVLGDFVDLVYEGPELEIDGDGGDVIQAFADMEIEETMAEPAARLVARVLDGVHYHYFDLQNEVRTLARKLAAAGAPKEELRRILDQASRLGCGGSELADELGLGEEDKQKA